MKPFFGHPKRFFIIILAVIAVGLIATVSHYSDYNKEAGYKYRKAGGDSINVAIQYSPMSMYRYGDSLGGLNYEVLKMISQRFGEKFRYHPISSVAEGIDLLERGKYDLLVADIPVTSALKEKFLFTIPVYTDRQVLVDRDTTITNPLSLAGKEVWVIAGTPASERLENLSREIGDSIHIHQTKDYTAEQLVILTANGTIPRAVVNEEVAKKIQKDYPDIVLSTHVSFSQFQSWLLNNDHKELVDKLDKEIKDIQSTQQYDSLLVKWIEE